MRYHSHSTHTSDQFGLLARKHNLTRLGYLTYNAYLQDSRWQHIRTQILTRDGHRCQDPECNIEHSHIKSGAVKLHVHHTNYNIDTLLGNSPESLITLCSECHDIAHTTAEEDSNNINQDEELKYDDRIWTRIQTARFNARQHKLQQDLTPRLVKHRKLPQYLTPRLVKQRNT